MRFRILRRAVGIALAAAAASAAWAQEKGAAHGEKPQPGIAVGQKAPDFTLKDQDGNERSLKEFLGKGNVALVFYRSADW